MGKKLALIFALIMIMMTGCGTPQAQSETVNVVLDWMPNTNHTGMYIALEKGYYAEEGLNVKIEQPPESGAEALVSEGGADFGVSAQESIAPGLVGKNQINVTAVAALLQHNTSGIVSLKKEGITSPKGLEGKTYATWDMPVETKVMEKVMERDGGSYENVDKIPTVTDVLTALSTDVDAVWIFWGWDGIAAEVKGIDVNYWEFRDIVPEFDWYTPILIANNDFLSEKPEIAEKFLAATAKGYEYAIEHPQEAAEILVKYAPETDLEIATKSQEYLADQYKAEVSQWGYIDTSRWESFFNWLYQEGITEENIGVRGFTNDYLTD